MANGGRIDFTVGFKTDKSGLTEIRNQLNEIKKLMPTDLMNLNPGMKMDGPDGARSTFAKLQKSISQIDVAFKSAFNTTTQQMNLTKLNSSLKQLDISKIATQFNAAGKQGQQAFYNITKSALTTNLQLNKTQTIVDKMGTTLINTLKWNISSSLINRFTGAFQEAYGYVQHLDTSLNDIRIVTGKSADEMERFAVSANNAAKDLGKATTDYTEAALIYYQQGLADEEVQARAETTLKASNVTGQSASEVSEQLTAVWNGYKVSAEETEIAVDRLAAVAATTAADLEELSKGMSKVASAANSMGVDMDQLNATIATIESVTRQAPESVGTALKTIYARMGDLKVGEADEDGTELGEVSSTLQKVGIEILDVNGDLRDMGTVMEEIGEKWDTWSKAEQQAIAIAVAGKRQYNNLFALFDNWDMYTKALETSRNSIGTLQSQQDIYMESTAAHIQQLKTEWEDLYDSLLDTKDINNLIDSLTKVLSLFTNFIDGIGGGKNALLGLGSTALMVFSKQISGELTKLITNMGAAKDRANEIAAASANIELFSKAKGMSGSAGADAIIEAQNKMRAYYDVLSAEQIEAATKLAEQAGEEANIKQQWDESTNALNEYVKALGKLGYGGTKAGKDDQGNPQQVPAVSGYDAKKTSLDGEINTTRVAVNEAFDEVDKASEKMTSLNEHIRETFENLQNQQEESHHHWKTFIRDTEGVKETLQDLENETSDLIGLYEKLNDAELFKGSDVEVEKTINELKELKQQFSDLLNNSGKMPKVVKNINTHMDKANNGINDGAAYLKKINGEMREAKGTTEGLGLSFNTSKDALDHFLDQATIQNSINNFTQLAGSIGQVASGLSSIKNLGNIWNNEDLSMGEKILQTMTSLGMGASMLVSGISRMSNSWKELAPLLQKNISGFIASGQALSANNLTFRENVELQKKKIEHEEKENLLKRQQKAEIIQNTIATEGETVAEEGEIVASEGQIAANTVETISLTGLIAATWAHVKALAAEIAAMIAAHPVISAITAGLALLAATIGIVAANAKKAREAEAESAKATLEESKKTTEAIKEEKAELDELASSYKSLKEEYTSHSISKEDLQKKAYDLALAYGREDLAVQALTGNYEKLESTIAQLQQDNNLDFIDSATQQMKDFQNYLERDIWKEMSKKERDTYVGINKDGSVETIKTMDLKGYGVKNYEEKGLQNELEKLGIQHYGSGHIDLKDLVTAATENRDELEAVLNQYSGTEAAQQLKEWLGKYEDEYGELEDEIKNKLEENRNLDFSKADLSTYEDAKKAYDEYIKVALEEGLTWDQANKQFSDYANTLDNEFAKRLAQEQATMAYLESGYLKYQNEHGIDTSNFEDTHAKTQELLDELSSRGLENDTSLLTAEEWENYYLGEWDIDEILSKMEERQKDRVEKLKNDFLNNSLTEFNDTLSKTMSSALEGNLTSEDEGYGALKDQLESIKDAFPELRSQIETFNNEGLIGTEHWIQAAHELQDVLNQMQFDQLNKKFKDEMDDITPTLDDTQFQKEMDELLDADYEINVKIHSDAEDEFEELEQSMDSMDSMADKIGEDFIVAADDLRELNNTFPGILEGMEYLADGTVQLNEDVVKSAMDAASKEEMASTEATITKLKNSAAELRAKAKVYDEMADLAWEAAKDEGNADKAKSEITTKLKELESENDKNVTDTEIDNAHLVVDDSATNAPILAENWTQSYQKAAKAANEWAEVAIAANEAVASNNPSKIKTGDFGVNFTGQNSKASEKASVADVNNATSTDDWAVLAQKYTDTAEGLRKQANDIEGMAAELGAKAIDSIQKNKDIGSGKHSDSSGSDSSKDADHEEYLERETDLYRTINMELDDIEKTLGRIQNIESHEWGIDYQKTLEEENDLLDKQLDKLKQKKAIQEQDLSIRRKQLEDVGVSFNAEGSVMNNAEETLNSLYANYNAMAAKYNAMSAEQQEGFKATLETEKDRIEKIEKKMSEYESTFSDYQSTLDSLLEAHYAEIENEVKKFNNMVEVHLELSEAKREWNDFWYDVVQDIDDDDFAKQIEKSFGKLDSLILGTDNDVSVLTGHLNDTVTEVEALIASANRGGEDSLFGDDTAAAKENLEDYRDKLMKALTEAKEEVDNISENYIKMLEHAQDLIDDQVDGWESIGDHLEHNMELIKLVSGDKAFDALNKQYEKQYQNNLNLVNAQKQSQDFWAGEIERYKQLLEVTDKNTVQWKTYSEALEKASENYKQAVEDLDKTVEEALKNLEDWRKNQSDAIMDAIDKAMSGGLGLDLVEQEWKLINDQAGKYLDNVQRAYNMEEYANELDKAANATGLSAINQAKLNAFREQELAQLREKDKLTKYDIEESRARLAILQQQLALEDAQRNKSNMRLRRDSQGNYIYQYTTDENAVDETEGGLLTAKKEWYELVKARRKETNDWIIEAEKNLASILAQIDEAEKAGDVDRLNKLKDMELLIRQEVQDAYVEAGKNIQDIYNGVAIYFADVNNAAILPENAAVVSQLIKDWAGEGEESFLGAVKKALIDITGLQEEFGRKTEKILEEAGINYTKLKEKGIDPVDESLEDLQMDNEDLAIALEDVNDQLTTQEGNLRQVEAAYYALQSAAVSAIQSANAALVALARTAVQTQMQVAAAIAAARSAPAITGTTPYQKNTSSGGEYPFRNYTGKPDNTGGDKPDKSKPTITTLRPGTPLNTTITKTVPNSNSSKKSSIWGKLGIIEEGTVSTATTKTVTVNGANLPGMTYGNMNPPTPTYPAAPAGITDPIKNGYFFDERTQQWVKLSGFATGGYTGAWPGSDGKLAVLHQKELVLNESDTKNILGAVEAIRTLDFNGVAKSLVQSANIQAQVLASVGESVLQALNVNQGDSVSNYRNVTVNADFSGVRSADAIYQALMELENTGMQTSFAN